MSLHKTGLEPGMTGHTSHLNTQEEFKASLINMRLCFLKKGEEGV